MRIKNKLRTFLINIIIMKTLIMLIRAIGCIEASNSSTTSVPPVAIALNTTGNRLINLMVPYDSKTSAHTAFALFSSSLSLKIEQSLASPSSPFATYATELELIPKILLLHLLSFLQTPFFSVDQKIF